MSEYNKLKELENYHWWFRGRRYIVESIINRLRPNTNRILDLGCGTGYFVDRYGGVGVEPHTGFRSDNILPMRIEDAVFMEKFDCVLALDVLEHLEDDRNILRFIKYNVAPGGIAIITVPANKNLYSIHDEVSGHYRRYDYSDLESLLKDFNPSIVYFNSLLYPIEYMVRRLTHGKNNLGKLPEGLNLILYKIFKSEYKMLGKFSRGLSLMAIIKLSEDGEYTSVDLRRELSGSK